MKKTIFIRLSFISLVFIIFFYLNKLSPEIIWEKINLQLLSLISLKTDEANNKNNHNNINNNLNLININNQQEEIKTREENKISYKEFKKEIKILKKINKNKEISDNNNSSKSLTNDQQQNLVNLEILSSTIEKILPTTTTTSSPKTNQSYYYQNNQNDNPQEKNDLCNNYQNKNYPNLIISEVQFETEDTKDEFIEFYNPHNEEVDLTCWSLEKYPSKQNPTSTPSLNTLIPQSKFKGKIKPYSFFLVTSSSTKEKYSADLFYPESYSISKNNTIILKKPNKEISDLIGYGDNQEKIYQYENLPFLAKNFNNKSIQRKNFQDTNNNSQDFWLRSPNPENSLSSPRKAREGFIDLTNIDIQNFNVSLVTSTDENEEIKYFLQIFFLDSSIIGGSTSDNYSFQILISTTSDFSSFFYSTTTQAKFDNSTTTLMISINECLNKNYYFSLFLQDNLDNENKSKTSTLSIELPDNLCNQEQIVNNVSPYKILISEVRIIEGTSTNEYIELYNPTTSTVNLTGWKLIKINSQGNTSTIISPRSKGKFEKITMPSFSYLLLANENISNLGTIPNIIYAKSNDLTKNNSLILLDNNNQEVDRFSWFEASNDKVYQRKKLFNCQDEIENNNLCLNLGNAYDTNEIEDFILTLPEPDNSEIIRKTIIDLDPPSPYKPQAIIDNNQEEKFIISWVSPALYQKENLHYQILIATSTSQITYEEIINFNQEKFYQAENFANFNLPSFHLLKKEKITLKPNLEKLNIENLELAIFKLLLKNNEEVILESKPFKGIIKNQQKESN